MLENVTHSSMQVLCTASPHAKADLTHRAWKAYCEGAIPLHAEEGRLELPPDSPARPARPQLVPPKQVLQGPLTQLT